MSEVNLREFRVPCFCPVCGFTMKGKSTNTFYDSGCCIDCHIWFLEGRPGNIEKWKAGWRPNKEEMDRFFENMKQ